MSLATGTTDRATTTAGWGRFPVNILLADGRMQRLFPKLLWLVVPFAYYYVTTIAEGFNPESYIPTAAFVVLLVTSMALAGGVIALVLPPWTSSHYFDKARGLIATLLGIWAVALALECLSYFVTRLIDPVNPENVVRVQLCSWADTFCFGWRGPAFSHTIYALAGALLLIAIIRGIARLIPATDTKSNFKPVPEPYILLGVIVVGLLMQFFDGVITSVRWS